MQNILNSTCSKCKKEKEKLYQIETYWTPVIQVNNLGSSIQRTYNLDLKNIVTYQICTDCVEKKVKFYKIFYGVLFTLIVSAILFGITQSLGFPLWLSILIGTILLPVGSYLALRVNVSEKAKLKIIDEIARGKLDNDISWGRINEADRLKKKNIRLLTWSELTKMN